MSKPDDFLKRALNEVSGIADAGAECADVVICQSYEHIVELHRKTGMPLGPHTKDQCADCGADIIVSNLSPKSPKRICMTCAAPLLAADTNPIMVTSEKAMPLVELLRKVLSEDKDKSDD